MKPQISQGPTQAALHGDAEAFRTATKNEKGAFFSKVFVLEAPN